MSILLRTYMHEGKCTCSACIRDREIKAERDSKLTQLLKDIEISPPKSKMQLILKKDGKEKEKRMREHTRYHSTRWQCRICLELRSLKKERFEKSNG